MLNCTRHAGTSAHARLCRPALPTPRGTIARGMCLPSALRLSPRQVPRCGDLGAGQQLQLKRAPIRARMNDIWSARQDQNAANHVPEFPPLSRLARRAPGQKPDARREGGTPGSAVSPPPPPPPPRAASLLQPPPAGFSATRPLVLETAPGKLPKENCFRFHFKPPSECVGFKTCEAWKENVVR